MATKQKTKRERISGVNVPFTDPKMGEDLLALTKQAGDMPLSALARIFIQQGIARCRETGKLDLAVPAAA